MTTNESVSTLKILYNKYILKILQSCNAPLNFLITIKKNRSFYLARLREIEELSFDFFMK